MKNALYIMILLLAIITVSTGCGGGSEEKKPTLPTQGLGNDFDGDQPEVPVPIPYERLAGEIILDMERELDGDLVISTKSTTFLYTPYGLLKRDDFGPANVNGLANNDTGRGMSFYTSDGNNCGPRGMVDDRYAPGGDYTTTFDPQWLNGKPSPDIKDICDLTITLDWSCPTGEPPFGYAYHPFSNRTYIVLNSNDRIIGDSDCESNWLETLGNEIRFSNRCGGGPLGNVILSYDQSAPFLDGWWNGNPDEAMDIAGDWIFYVPYDKWDCLQTLATLASGYQRMANSARVFSMNGTDPISSTPTPRDGLDVGNITDFEFDYQGRMIAAVSASDAYIITRPIVDGEHIIVDKVIGGRMNGMGTGPGEFQGPTGVSINPLTQEHVISDSGNDRIQVFTSQGDFVRQFRTGPNPKKALHDSWGNLLVATDNGLEIYNNQGSEVAYGSIEGFVQDKESGLPLEKANVFIVSTFDLPVQSAITTEDGFFQLSTVPVGSHNLVVSKTSYFDASLLVDVTALERTEVNFYVNRISTQPPGTGNVTGTLIKEGPPSEGGGQGIPGLAVGVEGLGTSDITNDNGEFMLYGVTSGPHKLQVSINGQLIWEGNIQVPDGQTLDIGLVSLYI